MIREYLFARDPFAGFDHGAYPLDLTGFRLPESVLARVADQSPRLVLEVGSWKGRSAIYMAEKLKSRNLDCPIVCIDTWLGAAEMWTKPEREDVPERYAGMNLKHGYPSLYYQFLANVAKSGHADRITPLPNTSVIGARILQRMKVKADFIFIDGSHDYIDVLQDLEHYWDLLADNGVIVGDDFDWPGVSQALAVFQRDRARAVIDIYPDTGWMMRKADTDWSRGARWKWKLGYALRRRQPLLREHSA